MDIGAAVEPPPTMGGTMDDPLDNMDEGNEDDPGEVEDDPFAAIGEIPKVEPPKVEDEDGPKNPALVAGIARAVIAGMGRDKDLPISLATYCVAPDLEAAAGCADVLKVRVAHYLKTRHPDYALETSEDGKPMAVTGTRWEDEDGIFRYGILIRPRKPKSEAAPATVEDEETDEVEDIGPDVESVEDEDDREDEDEVEAEDAA